VADVTSVKQVRLAEVCIEEQKCNLTQDFLVKSKLVQHAYEECHKICWEEAKVLQIGRNITHRKYQESVLMSLLDHPISQPILDTSLF
jgi:hypothetical protein